MNTPQREARTADNVTDAEKKRGRRPEARRTPQGGPVQTVKRTITEFKEDNLTDSAAALTYYAVLSIFPALIALVSIVGLVLDPQDGHGRAHRPGDLDRAVVRRETFKGRSRGSRRARDKAGILLIVGIAGALWTASGYVGAFMRASNVIYEVEEGRRSSGCGRFRSRHPGAGPDAGLVLVALVVTGPVAEEVGSALGMAAPP